ncbi:hypothetical protein [Leptospira bandrabouensis]|uniref:hypothetical protein n=1 Tax=Leptospira bandrabouensis TaxID=2484903 RepID=UPI001EEBB425|nr:hypothetical protein [Leptospira bandrabouensis]MCG6154122.1 hypothetical protein [Leptospira bandrabouensis]
MKILERKYLLLSLNFISCEIFIDWANDKILKNNYRFNSEKFVELAGLNKSIHSDCESVKKLIYELIIKENKEFNINNQNVIKPLLALLKKKAKLVIQKRLDIFSFLEIVDSINYLYKNPNWLENLNYFYSSIQDSDNPTIDSIPMLKNEIIVFLNK